MKVTTSPSESEISFSTAFRRSSNSPRYLAPATIADRSRLIDPLAPEALGDVTLDDPLREALDNRGLADPRLADEHRIVLGPAAEDLDDPADLLVPADDRVELSLVRELGEVPAVALESEVLVLGALRGHPVASAHLAHRGQQLVAARPDQIGHRK